MCAVFVGVWNAVSRKERKDEFAKTAEFLKKFIHLKHHYPYTLKFPFSFEDLFSYEVMKPQRLTKKLCEPLSLGDLAAESFYAKE